MLNIAERHLISHPDSKKFPFIYPLVYSNDHKKYTAPLNLWDLFENSELVKETWSGDYQFINLRDISDDKLKESPWLAPLQILMKYINEPDLLPRWQQIADILPEFADSNIGVDYVKSAISYTLTKIKEDDKIELEKILKSHLNPELGVIIMGSLAHRWEQDGRKKEKITIAKKLIKAGLKTELIITSTGLQKEEIEKLKSKSIY
ncbi:Rpn family recombination-promoting nuclease/putative transposase [Rickettsia endosymbiont of Nabis limbatus]|uniref:Rpn family recombination-promoting nuclease/putative transposase n=1 Tax=Rickettsia endosymbiont of Nabis limbatus TaxID=3066268 RepID=UPI003AF352A8